MKRPVLIEIEPQTAFSISVARERNLTATLDSVPGSVLRGALATAYRRRWGEDEPFRTAFLSDRNRFPHCRPGPGAPRPAPLTARTCKHHPGEVARGGHGVRDELLSLVAASSNGESGTRAVEVCPTCEARLVRYSGLLPRRQGGAVQGVRRAVRMHVAIDRATGTARPGLLYGHEVILPQAAADEPGSQGRQLILSGLAWLEEEDLPTLHRAAEEPVWIGRSRSSGFGRVRVAFRPMDQGQPSEGVKERLERWQRAVGTHSGRRPLCVSLTSPAILHDRALRYAGRLSDHLAECLQLDQEGGLEMVRTELVPGWNMAGRLPKTTDVAVSAGSFLFGWSGLPVEELANVLGELEREGIGSRRSEGFGAVICPDTAALDQTTE